MNTFMVKHNKTTDTIGIAPVDENIINEGVSIEATSFNTFQKKLDAFKVNTGDIDYYFFKEDNCAFGFRPNEAIVLIDKILRENVLNKSLDYSKNEPELDI